jgi:hypothetical protein
MTAAEHRSKREDNAEFGIGTVAEHWMGCPCSTTTTRCWARW